MSKFGFQVLVLGLVAIGSIAFPSGANAQDPSFGFMYGYSVGRAQSFRTSLPAPPYFAVYPPVYYGEKYSRPYGDSPFASPPTLQSNPNYRPEATRERTQTIVNPYCVNEGAAPVSIEAPTPVAMGQKVTIINPFAVETRESVVTK